MHSKVQKGQGVSWGSGLNATNYAAKIFAHGMVGGVMSVLQGGKFGHGFSSAGLTQAFSGAIDGIGGNKMSSAYYDAGNRATRIIAASVVGGTASEMSGGKFANGAITGAFSRAFNDEAHQSRLESKQRMWREYAERVQTKFANSAPARIWNGLNRSLTWSVGLGGGLGLKTQSPGFDFEIGGGVMLEGVYTPEGSFGRLQGEFTALSISWDGLGSGSLINIGQTDTFSYDQYNFGSPHASPGALNILNNSVGEQSWGVSIHALVVKFSMNVDLNKF